MNTSHISGHLGRDIDIRALEDGSLVGEMSVGVNDYDGLDEGGKPIYVTTWVTAVLEGNRVMRKQDELLRGRKVHIQGKLRTRRFKVSDDKSLPLTYIKVQEIEVEPAAPVHSTESQ